MAIIEKFTAPGVFDPATYSQGIKVSQAQTILFLSGQVAYTPDGGVAFRGDFKGQARGAYEAIKALNQLEVNKYIRFRLKTAGADRVNLFDDEALDLIAAASQGIPRVINNVCDNALLYGYAAGTDVVSRGVIEEVLESLDIQVPEVSSF